MVIRYLMKYREIFVNYYFKFSVIKKCLKSRQIVLRSDNFGVTLKNGRTNGKYRVHILRYKHVKLSETCFEKISFYVSKVTVFVFFFLKKVSTPGYYTLYRSYDRMANFKTITCIFTTKQTDL